MPFNVLGCQSGVRPATADRRPWVGRHPLYPQAMVCNGLGTKGVSLAPWLATQLARVLAQGISWDKGIEHAVSTSRLKVTFQ